MESVDWSEVFDRLLPVFTLFLGAGIARGSTRREQRIKAASELSDLHKRVWRKFHDDDWVELKSYLGRLRVALRSGGVPVRLVDPLIAAADAFWQSVYDTGQDDLGLGVSTEVAHELDFRQGLVLDWLDRRWHPLQGWNAWRAAVRSPTRPSKTFDTSPT